MSFQGFVKNDGQPVSNAQVLLYSESKIEVSSPR